MRQCMGIALNIVAILEGFYTLISGISKGRRGSRHVAFFLLLGAVGCAQVQLIPYLDQVLVLKEFGDNKDGQHAYVHQVNGKFDALRAAIGSGEIKRYHTKADVIKAFGPPIFTKGNKILYRHATAFKDPHKVYLYFDDQEQLVRWEYL